MANNVLISPIKEMEIRSSRIPGVVSLAQGVPSFDTPLCIKRKAIEMMEEGKAARYSLAPGLLELREAIEHKMAKSNIFYDFEKEIIVTAGSIEAITATLLALLEPGDEVMVLDPSYTSYQSAITTARAKPIFVPLDEKTGWSFDFEELEKRLSSRTRAILLCNPNNPTGTVFSREQLMKLAQFAEYHNLYILSDEVYRDFIYNEDPYCSIAQFSSFRKRIIYIFSFSKAYAMTGWRVAYLAADAELTEKILGIHDALVTCAPVISQWGALAALEMADQDVAEFKAEFFKRKNIICDGFKKMPNWFSFVEPNSSYFIFPKISSELERKISLEKLGEEIEIKDYQENSLSWKFALELLYEAKVAVVPGVAFGPSGENHIRLCFGRSKQDIEETMKRIKIFLEKL
jgi:aminotransferase